MKIASEVLIYSLIVTILGVGLGALGADKINDICELEAATCDHVGFAELFAFAITVWLSSIFVFGMRAKAGFFLALVLGIALAIGGSNLGFIGVDADWTIAPLIGMMIGGFLSMSIIVIHEKIY